MDMDKLMGNKYLPSVTNCLEKEKQVKKPVSSPRIKEEQLSAEPCYGHGWQMGRTPLLGKIRGL